MNRIAPLLSLLFVAGTPSLLVADEPPTSQPADWAAWVQSEAADPNWGPAENEEASRLLQQLSSPKFALREQATERLLRMGLGLYRLLIPEYEASRDLEQRIRIRGIAYELYMDHKLPWFNAGFVGIQMLQRDEGMLVSRVLPGTAAERAGLEAYDIIVEVDGVRVPPNPNTQEFAGLISSHRAGDTVNLMILRTGEVRALSVVLGRRPANQQLAERQTELLAAEEVFDAVWQQAVRSDAEGE